MRSALEGLSGGRVVVIGVGNRLRGDDGAGSLLAQRLERACGAFVFDGGSAPENYCERVGALRPALVLIIDAARFGGTPGEVRIFEPDEIASGALSTHDSSLRLVSDYLRARCGCGLLILGIEPATDTTGSELSPPVSAAMSEIEACLREMLQ